MGITSKPRSSPNPLALTVLALLIEQSRHPYEMQRLMRERHKDFAVGKARSFYDAVDRLARDGLVEPLETSRAGKRPERTVYRITAEGREEFKSWLGELLSTPVAEYPLFTVAVSFLAYLPPQEAISVLEARVVALEGALAGTDASLRALQEQLHLPRLFLLEHEHIQALRRAELAWVRTVIADIRAGRFAWDIVEWRRQADAADDTAEAHALEQWSAVWAWRQADAADDEAGARLSLVDTRGAGTTSA
jgi:DNA-binding PadR family transcriptional regulator